MPTREHQQTTLHVHMVSLALSRREGPGDEANDVMIDEQRPGRREELLLATDKPCFTLYVDPGSVDG